ncbi:MAG: hypothetical protein IKW30_11750 [Lachnospiraceae bacterium]|nr:hypothetical protein [Lachnospiraceae bacterium]
MVATEIRMQGSNGKQFKVAKTDRELINEICMYTQFLQKLCGIRYILKFANQFNHHFLDHLKEATDQQFNSAVEIRNVYCKEAEAREIKYSFVEGDLLNEAIKTIESVNRYKDYHVEIVFEKNEPQRFKDISTKDLVNIYINMVVFMSEALNHAGFEVIGWSESDILRAIYFVWMEITHRDTAYKCRLHE